MTLLRHLPVERVHEELSAVVHEVISARLHESRPGHCLRVSSLQESVMRELCARLRDEFANTEVVLLLGPWQPASAPYDVTATRLVELRNEGTRPLLVFVPPGIKTAAEDSFGVSTFAEIDLRAAPRRLRTLLRNRLPAECQSLTDRAIQYLGETERLISDDDVVRYYLAMLESPRFEGLDASEHLEAAGAAIYQLHLLPDRGLFTAPDRIKQRLGRNVEVLSTIVDSTSPLLGRIHQLKLKRNTIQADLYGFLRHRALGAVEQWGEEIACDAAWEHLAFDRWEFEGETTRDRVRLYVDELDLPARNLDAPIGPDNPRYLDVKRTSRIRLKWDTDPKPASVDGLAHFRIEIVSSDTEGGAIAWESGNIGVGKSAGSTRTRTLKVADFRDQFSDADADGLYFFRVRAYSESGDILNEEDAEADPRILRDPANPAGKRQYESEDVWFWVEEGDPPPADSTRNVTVQSFLEAQLLTRLAAVDRGDDPFSESLRPQPDRTRWAVAKGTRSEATFNIVFDSQSRYTLTVSNRLRSIESETLRHPENLGRWRLNFSQGEQGMLDAVAVERPFNAPERVPEAFLRARRVVFQAIQGGTDDRLTSTVDLHAIADKVLAYADAYAAWLRQAEDDFAGQAIREEGGRKRSDALFLDLDLLEVLMPGEGLDSDRVYLMSPTHPLRMLWHLQTFNLVSSWLAEAQKGDQPSVLLNSQIRTYLRHGLLPANLPPVLRPTHAGYSEGLSHFYVEHTPVTPFWGLYLREDAQDTRTLEARVRTLLGVSRAVAVSGAVGGDVLAQSITRYLVQHPYVHQLKVNVFNPGDAGLIVDAILEVERARLKARLPGLRYELRLFTRGERLDDVGAAVADLLDPERQVSAEADAFSVASDSLLYPKLHYSRGPLHDFEQRPEAYEAHISVLHELFGIDVALRKQEEGRSSFVHGLVQDQVTFFPAGDGQAADLSLLEYAWYRQLVPSACRELPGDTAGHSARIANLLSRLAVLQASVAAGTGQLEAVVPAVCLSLGPAEKALIHTIHSVSDWVLTVDRHIGLDYFDRDVSDSRPLYLLDFRPEYGATSTERLLLTTRSIDEIQRLIRPALEEHELLAGQDGELFFLQMLRSLSGKLALKLLSAPTQVSEALGLAFARLFLEQYALLEDRVVLPLDAHADLFAGGVVGYSGLADVSLQRGDLLLVACDPQNRKLHFNVVEVKFHSDVGGVSGFLALQQRIESQVTNTIEVLGRHFDPDRDPIDRLDRQVKTRELVSLLSFYLERSHRYGLVTASAREEIRDFLATLDMGYSLECRATGLVFDQAHRGIDVCEEHPGLVFYRLGRDYVERLLSNGLRRRAAVWGDEAPSAPEISEPETDRQIALLKDTTFYGDPSYERVRTTFSAVPSHRRPHGHEDPLGHGQTPDGEDAGLPAGPATPGESRTNADAAGTAKEPSMKGVELVPGVEDSTGDRLSCDVLLGDTSTTRQFGLIGMAGGRRIALDLDGTNTISLFGVQGSGKSYTVGMVAEMACQEFAGINDLRSPLATVIFHYHQSQDYPPEFVTMAEENSDLSAIDILARDYAAQPSRLRDVVVLTSADKLAQRRAEFAGLTVEPILFSSSELSFKDWRFLMGVGGSQMYMKQINLVMRQLRDDMTLDRLRDRIEASDLTEGQKSIARIRLDFAAQFIDDSRRLAQVLRPGRLVIVDLRDEFIDKEEALGLFVVMLDIFANTGRDAEHGFNKLIVFDEAHKYMDNPDLTGHIVDVIRQMRHQGVSVLIASQDPPSLPQAIIELSSVVIMHRFNSPQWLRHVQKSVTGLAELNATEMAALRPGEGYVWASRSTERVFTQRAVKMRFRPRVTQHGGGTRTAT